jgi:hypothetical protein
MRYWFDTEFLEDGQIIDLISIGIVAEDGREYYAVSTNFNSVRAFDHEWLKAHVLPHLPYKRTPATHPDVEFCWVFSDPDYVTGLWKSRRTIREDLLLFCNPEQYGKPEFWAYYADYDWVALCQLFGRMIDLPRGWPMYCRDLKQLADMLGKPKLPEQGKSEHHALADAKWNKQAYDFLIEYGYAAGFPETMLRA